MTLHEVIICLLLVALFGALLCADHCRRRSWEYFRRWISLIELASPDHAVETLKQANPDFSFDGRSFRSSDSVIRFPMETPRMGVFDYDMVLLHGIFRRAELSAVLVLMDEVVDAQEEQGAA